MTHSEEIYLKKTQQLSQKLYKLYQSLTFLCFKVSAKSILLNNSLLNQTVSANKSDKSLFYEPLDRVRVTYTVS